MDPNPTDNPSHFDDFESSDDNNFYPRDMWDSDYDSDGNFIKKPTPPASSEGENFEEENGTTLSDAEIEDSDYQASQAQEQGRVPLTVIPSENKESLIQPTQIRSSLSELHPERKEEEHDERRQDRTNVTNEHLLMAFANSSLVVAHNSPPNSPSKHPTPTPPNGNPTPPPSADPSMLIDLPAQPPPKLASFTAANPSDIRATQRIASLRDPPPQPAANTSVFSSLSSGIFSSLSVALSVFNGKPSPFISFSSTPKNPTPLLSTTRSLVPRQPASLPALVPPPPSPPCSPLSSPVSSPVSSPASSPPSSPTSRESPRMPANMPTLSVNTSFPFTPFNQHAASTPPKTPSQELTPPENTKEKPRAKRYRKCCPFHTWYDRKMKRITRRFQNKGSAAKDIRTVPLALANMIYGRAQHELDRLLVRVHGQQQQQLLGNVSRTHTPRLASCYLWSPTMVPQYNRHDKNLFTDVGIYPFQGNLDDIFYRLRTYPSIFAPISHWICPHENWRRGRKAIQCPVCRTLIDDFQNLFSKRPANRLQSLAPRAMSALQYDMGGLVASVTAQHHFPPIVYSCQSPHKLLMQLQQELHQQQREAEEKKSEQPQVYHPMATPLNEMALVAMDTVMLEPLFQVLCSLNRRPRETSQKKTATDHISDDDGDNNDDSDDEEIRRMARRDHNMSPFDVPHMVPEWRMVNGHMMAQDVMPTPIPLQASPIMFPLYAQQSELPIHMAFEDPMETRSDYDTWIAEALRHLVLRAYQALPEEVNEEKEKDSTIHADRCCRKTINECHCVFSRWEEEYDAYFTEMQQGALVYPTEVAIEQKYPLGKKLVRQESAFEAQLYREFVFMEGFPMDIAQHNDGSVSQWSIDDDRNTVFFTSRGNTHRHSKRVCPEGTTLVAEEFLAMRNLLEGSTKYSGFASVPEKSRWKETEQALFQIAESLSETLLTSAHALLERMYRTQRALASPWILLLTQQTSPLSPEALKKLVFAQSPLLQMLRPLLLAAQFLRELTPFSIWVTLKLLVSLDDNVEILRSTWTYTNGSLSPWPDPAVFESFRETILPPYEFDRTLLRAEKLMDKLADALCAMIQRDMPNDDQTDSESDMDDGEYHRSRHLNVYARQHAHKKGGLSERQQRTAQNAALSLNNPYFAGRESHLALPRPRPKAPGEEPYSRLGGIDEFLPNIALVEALPNLSIRVAMALRPHYFGLPLLGLAEIKGVGQLHQFHSPLHTVQMATTMLDSPWRALFMAIAMPLYYTMLSPNTWSPTVLHDVDDHVLSRVTRRGYLQAQHTEDSEKKCLMTPRHHKMWVAFQDLLGHMQGVLTEPLRRLFESTQRRKEERLAQETKEKELLATQQRLWVQAQRAEAMLAKTPSSPFESLPPVVQQHLLEEEEEEEDNHYEADEEGEEERKGRVDDGGAVVAAHSRHVSATSQREAPPRIIQKPERQRASRFFVQWAASRWQEQKNEQQVSTVSASSSLSVEPMVAEEPPAPVTTMEHASDLQRKKKYARRKRQKERKKEKKTAAGKNHVVSELKERKPREDANDGGRKTPSETTVPTSATSLTTVTATTTERKVDTPPLRAPIKHFPSKFEWTFYSAPMKNSLDRHRAFFKEGIQSNLQEMLWLNSERWSFDAQGIPMSLDVRVHDPDRGFCGISLSPQFLESPSVLYQHQLAAWQASGHPNVSHEETRQNWTRQTDRVSATATGVAVYSHPSYSSAGAVSSYVSASLPPSMSVSSSFSQAPGLSTRAFLRVSSTTSSFGTTSGIDAAYSVVQTLPLDEVATMYASWDTLESLDAVALGEIRVHLLTFLSAYEEVVLKHFVEFQLQTLHVEATRAATLAHLLPSLNYMVLMLQLMKEAVLQAPPDVMRAMLEMVMALAFSQKPTTVLGQHAAANAVNVDATTQLLLSDCGDLPSGMRRMSTMRSRVPDGMRQFFEARSIDTADLNLHVIPRSVRESPHDSKVEDFIFSSSIKVKVKKNCQKRRFQTNYQAVTDNTKRAMQVLVEQINQAFPDVHIQC